METDCVINRRNLCPGPCNLTLSVDVGPGHYTRLGGDLFPLSEANPYCLISPGRELRQWDFTCEFLGHNSQKRHGVWDASAHV